MEPLTLLIGVLIVFGAVVPTAAITWYSIQNDVHSPGGRVGDAVRPDSNATGSGE